MADKRETIDPPITPDVPSSDPNVRFEIRLRDIYDRFEAECGDPGEATPEDISPTAQARYHQELLGLCIEIPKAEVAARILDELRATPEGSRLIEEAESKPKHRPFTPLFRSQPDTGPDTSKIDFFK